jgi:2,4-didehydro-3-deoxy-L-rhamnonate hydrolase
MREFKLGTLSHRGEPFAALVVGDTVMRVDQLWEFGGDVSVASLLRDWPRSFEALHSAAARRLDGVPLVQCEILPPIHPPGAFLCAGANYRRHVVQMVVGHEAARGRPSQEVTAEAEQLVDDRLSAGIPFVFAGFPGAICGAYDDIVLPADGVQHDWELELAIVMGRRAQNVDAADAMDYVAGYTIVNDISTRDRMFRSDVPMTDFVATKMRPTFKPTGPFITPAEFVPEPRDLRVQLSVNGAMMQDEATADMIFGIDRLVEYVSGLTVLSPGDLILTGSPAGNAAHHGGRYLQPGDLLEGEITGLGAQRNRCVAATVSAHGPDAGVVYRATA